MKRASLFAVLLLALTVLPAFAQGGWKVADAEWVLEEDPMQPGMCRWISQLGPVDHPGFGIMAQIPVNLRTAIFSLSNPNTSFWWTHWFPCPPGLPVGSKVKTFAGSTGELGGQPVEEFAVCQAGSCTWTLPLASAQAPSQSGPLDLSGLGGFVLLAILVAVLLIFGSIRLRTA